MKILKIKKLLSFFILLYFLTIIISCNNKEKIPVVIISTKFGDMTFVLSDKTPKHSSNFAKLVKEGFYDSLAFHRIIKEFMVQGGDPKTKKHNPPVIKDYTLIPAEFRPTLFHKKGALAAARHENAAKASDPTQFYIVHGKKYTDHDLEIEEGQEMRIIPKDHKEVYKKTGGAPFLDNNYTVFGEMIDGFNILEVIATVETGPGDVPLEDIIMTVKLDTITK